ncbi:MAG TPA: hypothetical protein VIN08_01205 [Ohtaekwangia sp.]|uniref:hypothetical protein n=1 Tax=Ohtaekwangia sp. TaxID=2066019 RepID=UPI002F9577C9
MASSGAQVVNNDIQNGSVLLLDHDFIQSSTNHATVEWSCINKSLRSLTSKCLTYHNDQWFTFRVQQTGIYYLNIASQVCRDAKGIQAIVLEGYPCEGKPYRIMQCIAQIRDQDVFIALDSLQPGKDYFVNIDGFLGDFCSFKIQLSTEAKGFTLNNQHLDTLRLASTLDGKIVTLQWTADIALQEALEGFEIYRKEERLHKSVLIATVPIALNSIGTYTTEYSLQDTLKSSGRYVYEVAGVFSRSKIKQTLDRQQVEYRPSIAIDPFIYASLDYKSGTKIQLLLVDEMRDIILKQTSFVFDSKRDAVQKVYIGNYLDQGISSFLVVSTNLKTFEKRVVRFALSEQGKIERK